MWILDFKKWKLNEGAALTQDGQKAELNWRDNDSNPLEFLKSNFSFKHSKFVGGDFPFSVLYGLSIDESKMKELSGKPELKLLLDNLKNSKIVGGDQAIINFIKPAADELRRKTRNIDYIMPMGSTKGLSEDLAKAFNDLLSGSEIQDIAKYQFNDPVNALDWNYIQDYEENRVGTPKKGGGTVSSIMSVLAGYLYQEVNIEESSEAAVQRLRDIRQNREKIDWIEFKGFLLSSNPINKYHDPENLIVWKNTPYTIRSSGQSVMGSRRFFKTKYETPKEGGVFGDPKLTEAVKRCILSNKSLLLVDDNTRTKMDIKGILESIEKIAENIIADAGLDRRQAQSALNYRSRIHAYVLIYVPPKVGMAGDTAVKQYVTQNYGDFNNNDLK
jgi:hypothetical protein